MGLQRIDDSRQLQRPDRLLPTSWQVLFYLTLLQQFVRCLNRMVLCSTCRLCCTKARNDSIRHQLMASDLFVPIYQKRPLHFS